jgi:lysophospholipase L1-like esterase
MGGREGLMGFTPVRAFALLLFCLCGAADALAQDNAPAWVTSWSTSQQGLSKAPVDNATLRLIARVTLPGEAVRVRLDNSFGTQPVSFSHVTIAPRVRGPAVAGELLRQLTFSGKSSVTVPAGGTIETDPVMLHVEAQQDLAISLFVEGNVQPSQHNNAQVISYATENGGGDQTMSVDGKAFGKNLNSMPWLKSIDVRPSNAASAIVALGDSITDGTCSTPNAHDRWEDILSERFALETPVRRAVLNEGIGGNTAVNAPNFDPPLNSPAGEERFDRDVLSHAGISHLIIFLGTNDIRRGATAEQVIGGLKDMISRARAKGIKVIGATIVPRDSVVPGIADTGWNDQKTKIRNRVNDWIRKEAGFDGVLDFDRVVRSSQNSDLLNPAFNCSDGVHPSPIGYFEMGKSVDLRFFEGR